MGAFRTRLSIVRADPEESRARVAESSAFTREGVELPMQLERVVVVHGGDATVATVSILAAPIAMGEEVASRRMAIPTELLSLSVFGTLPNDQRLALATTLATALGDEYRASPELRGTARLAAVVHVASGVEFVIVPGGTFVAGLRPEEVEQMRGLEYVEDDAFESVESLAKEAKPRVATVRPFLCARAPVLRDYAYKLLGTKDGWVIGDEDSGASPVRYTKKKTTQLLEETPFRLLTADEWQWVAREGGRLAFVNGATPDEAEAACHALYGNAFDPTRSDEGNNAFALWGLPWGDWTAEAKAPRVPHEERGGAAMPYPWQSDEIIMALAAFGSGGDDQSCVRFALDLPTAQGRGRKKAATGAAMMAIVSRATFEKEMPRSKPGDLYKTDRYRSSGKALASLAGGGTLYLVTVRPPNEELWLVAVLSNVAEKAGAWIAPEGNKMRITNITALRGKLQFSNGKGISGESGAMAMSLQTPRTLSADDVALLGAK